MKTPWTWKYWVKRQTTYKFPVCCCCLLNFNWAVQNVEEKQELMQLIKHATRGATVRWKEYTSFGQLHNCRNNPCLQITTHLQWYDFSFETGDSFCLKTRSFVADELFHLQLQQNINCALWRAGWTFVCYFWGITCEMWCMRCTPALALDFFPLPVLFLLSAAS